MKISKQFTEEELEGIKTFRSRIKGKIADLKDDSFEKTYCNEDTTIWRYVLAQSQESDPMEKSEQMFFDSIKWRKDIKMYETLWEEWRGNQGKKNTKHAQKFLKFYVKSKPWLYCVKGKTFLISNTNIKEAKVANIIQNLN